MAAAPGLPSGFPCIPRAWRRGLLALLCLAPLLFGGCVATGGSLKGLSPTERAAEHARRFDRVDHLVRTRYYRADLHGMNWDRLRERYRPFAVDAPDEPAWYAIVNDMLNELRDAHTRVERPPTLRWGLRQAATASETGRPVEGESRVLADGTVVIRFDHFNASTRRWLRDEVARHRDAPALIVDLRRNRGGFVSANQRALGLFFRERLPIGTAVHRSGRRIVEEVRPARRVHYAGPLAVLVGPHSHSSAEVFARTLQFHRRAVVVGSPTAGEVLGAESFRLRDGGVLYVSTSDFIFCDGRRLEGVGVQPDVEVTGLRPGRDDTEDPVVRAAQRALGAAWTSRSEVAARR
jgi:C-terminal processing protease CtpA/Prc